MRYGLSEEIYLKIKNIINKFPQYQFKIFGSRARGDYKNSSDIDIAVFGDVTSQDEFLILNEFDLLDIIYTIDVLFIKKINKPSLIESIKKEGVSFI